MPTKHILLRYGAGLIEFDVPDGNLAYVLGPRKTLPASDVSSEIVRALSNPIGHPRISKTVGPEDKVAILADDITRPTPCDKLIPPILNELNGAGIEDQNILVIMALGTHRQLTKEEILRKVGKSVVERVEVVNHDYRDRRRLVCVGETSLGCPVWINKEFHEADFKIGLGNIIPHPFGWGGGAKIVQPGVSGEETTGYTHLMCSGLLHAEVIGQIDNPIRVEIERVAMKSGLNMIVNTVLNEDEQVVKVFAGDPIKAFREGVKLAEQIYRPRVPRRVDIAVATSYPADIDYWQGVKGAIAAARALQHTSNPVRLHT